MKKKIIKLTESDLTKLVRKIINEVGGYDDPTIMGRHASKTINTLSDSYSDLTFAISDLSNNLADGDISMDDSKEYLLDIIETVDEFIMVANVVMKDFTEDDLIRETKKIIKSLNKFTQKLRVLVTMKSSFANTDQEYSEKIKDLLIELVPLLREYSDKVNLTIQTFSGRLSKGGFGYGFN